MSVEFVIRYCGEVEQPSNAEVVLIATDAAMERLKNDFDVEIEERVTLL